MMRHYWIAVKSSPASVFSNCSRCCVFSLVCILMESKPFLCIICTIYNIISASLCCDWLSIFVAAVWLDFVLVCGGWTDSVPPNPEGGSEVSWYCRKAQGSEVSRYCRKACCCVRHVPSNHPGLSWTVNTSVIPTEGEVI